MLKVGDTGRLEVVRNGITRKVEVRIAPYDVPHVKIVTRDDATPRQLRLRKMWFDAT
jgi:hypothetical protein